MASPAFGARVTFLPLAWSMDRMRQVPRSVPAASRISTQWPPKYAGMFEARSVTSTAPPEPLCAVPEPSDGKTAGWPLMPLLSTVSVPYDEPGPCTKTVPGPPNSLRLLDACDDAERCERSAPEPKPEYAMEMAPPPPVPQLPVLPPRA